MTRRPNTSPSTATLVRVVIGRCMTPPQSSMSYLEGVALLGPGDLLVAQLDREREPELLGLAFRGVRDHPAGGAGLAGGGLLDLDRELVALAVLAALHVDGAVGREPEPWQRGPFDPDLAADMRRVR